MRDFEIVEGDENLIISLRRLSDGVVFKVGDDVSLIFQIKDGTNYSHFIEKFLTETDRSNKWFPTTIYPAGTMVTNTGILQLENTGHTDFTTEAYKIIHTPCLSIAEILKLTNHKYEKKLRKTVKEKLYGNS